MIFADYIRNIKEYLKEGGLAFCPLCVKVYCGKWHRCFAPRRCYACRRIKVYAGEGGRSFRTSMNFRNYCIRQMDKKCDNCETIYASDSCYKKHIRVKHCKEMKSGRSVTNLSTLRIGTDGWRAPETYNADVISKQADICIWQSFNWTNQGLASVF